MQKEFERWPAYYKAYIKCFERMIAERKRVGKPCIWETGEDVMKYWIDGMQREDERQLKIFDDTENALAEAGTRAKGVSNENVSLEL